MEGRTDLGLDSRLGMEAMSPRGVRMGRRGEDLPDGAALDYLPPRT